MTIYLYVKTHNKTGLKYLGKTSSKDPHKYKGSGTYWLAHLKKHGYDYTTTILRECQHPAMVEFWGTYYSDLWDVVKSKEWANLKPETGDGGSMIDVPAWREGLTRRTYRKPGEFKHTEETKEKIKEKRKLQTISPHSDETKKRLSASHTGKKLSEETKAKIRATKASNKRSGYWAGKPRSEETKAKIRATKALKNIKTSS